MKETGNTFIDHDDKGRETTLSEAFAWTSKIYQQMFQQLYSECTCWCCEAVREETRPSKISTILLPSKRDSTKSINNQVSHLFSGTEKAHTRQAAGLSDPNKNPHVSAHNAVPDDLAVSKRSIYSRHRVYQLLLERN